MNERPHNAVEDPVAPSISKHQQLSPTAKAQECTYHESADYNSGSPHLRHHALHGRLTDRLRTLVDSAFSRSGSCRILEVGGGHGTFTARLVEMGAQVTVSEISRHSAEHLAQQFDDDPSVSVIHDVDGEGIFQLPDKFDVILCISVLHHVPDYLRFVQRLTGLLSAGGSLASFQDPDWYPRRRGLHDFMDKYSYFAWRLTQGDLVSGARTRIRRLRGIYDETLAADMTEYHVVREGVDEQSLVALLSPGFDRVDVHHYWSTQSALLQAVGQKCRLRNTFAIEATGYRHDVSSSI